METYSCRSARSTVDAERELMSEIRGNPFSAGNRRGGSSSFATGAQLRSRYCSRTVAARRWFSPSSPAGAGSRPPFFAGRYIRRNYGENAFRVTRALRPRKTRLRNYTNYGVVKILYKYCIFVAFSFSHECELWKRPRKECVPTALWKILRFCGPCFHREQVPFCIYRYYLEVSICTGNGATWKKFCPFSCALRELVFTEYSDNSFYAKIVRSIIVVIKYLKLKESFMQIRGVNM